MTLTFEFDLVIWSSWTSTPNISVKVI